MGRREDMIAEVEKWDKSWDFGHGIRYRDQMIDDLFCASEEKLSTIEEIGLDEYDYKGD